ncbi:Asp-tRNA(Asn)/Glu-tRNA(Gln) amidotransferase subunit GatC [Melittangium boletus]|uniref:Aspartyl/glutamyl-tRNA(Asn/Gln) amidotransferase subunit C n=1 Tax=Melittangium boletus DSM 14713 TaxID=1294270 RepID=A0A250IIG9_9BACT|nr:Asp-tRNA(Asn)/Glu-tRNA(Gln) amidotransferase subunit GatC [Melittangium boletus]ATB31545.1 Aspartyl-tRNA(Asn) amidotransferase subunit C [Melittangium boletus DSM 14713]
MKLSVEQVRHVATLARLSLSSSEEERYAEQLSAILDAVAQLQELDVSGVEPTSHASLASALLREDAPKPSLTPDQALANAPARGGTSFAVPKILE